MKTTALIMAGGQGERFWPRSRKSLPKQFLALTISQIRGWKNRIMGDAVIVKSSRCIVDSGDKLIALVGMKNTIVVDTKDALLVCAMESTDSIRKVPEELRRTNRTDLL